MEYHVQNKKFLKQSASPHSPAEFEMYSECLDTEMKDKKARAATKIYTYVREKISMQPDKQYSHEDVAMMLREAIATQAKNATKERE